MTATGGLREGQRRIALAECPGLLIDVMVTDGRVELGHSAADRLRVRWTLPAPSRWLPRRWARTEPAIAVSSDGVRLRARRARLRLDLPAGCTVRVRVRRGEITSWGARGTLALRGPRVTCRELAATAVTVDAEQASVHFATPPDAVRVNAAAAVVALPAGEYAVTAPAGAVVSVTNAPTATRTIAVTGRHVEVLASAEPLALNEPVASADPVTSPGTGDEPGTPG